MDTSIGSDGEQSDDRSSPEESSLVSTADLEDRKRRGDNRSVSPLGDGHSLSTLKFSVENILSPEFGCKIRKSGSHGSPPVGGALALKKLCHSDAVLTTTAASAVRDRYSTTTATRTIELPVTLPAWVYCTRYSDRPSSGELHVHAVFLTDRRRLIAISHKS
ncbi:unnamed protein product [Soboliphyme baturini]|uniref:PID domain-containing protein n=1 Tax=Soboliphyme baturini TaxID=241478 RepID=A0A183J9G0_9BILA|nr:unnamed protein product [Soboliphyme baturini]